jgi:hypothetical protein
MDDTAAAAAPDDTFMHRFVARVQRERVFRDVFELALVAVAFLLYFAVRGMVIDRHAEALRNAERIIDLERALGMFWEPRLQELILDHRFVIHMMNFIYFWLDFPLIIAIGLWMYFARRHEYTVARDAILLSGAISLVIYNLVPVMPPRLLPGDVFVGTVEEYSNFSYQAQSTSAFVNPYAALPSLHFGWAVILGGALFFSTRNPLVRAFAVLIPWAQMAAIVFTANHYILDAAAGLVVCLVGIWLALAMQRWGYPALRREVDRRWGAPPPPAEAPVPA